MIVVSGAAGGVGTVAVQLARNAGAMVVALASPNHHDWLRAHGSIPVTYGDGVVERIRDAAGGRVDALIDTYGGGYVELGISSALLPSASTPSRTGMPRPRYGAKTDGNAAGASADVLEELAALVVDGRLEVPIAATFPLSEVREAFQELEQRHTLGKIVLHP